MPLGRATPGAEHLFASRSEERKARREQSAARRIVACVAKTAEAGKPEYNVGSSFLRDIWLPTREPSVYAAAAERLTERGIEIEVHRYDDTLPVDDSAHHYDIVTITSVGGTAMAAEASRHDKHSQYVTHVAQLYPPPFDEAGQHNLSLSQ